MSTAAFLRTVVSINAAALLLAVVIGLAKNGDPSRYFGEGRILTVFSCLQLLVAAYYFWQIGRIRGKPTLSLTSPSTLWPLLACGFVFLAADDAFQIHENVDFKVHEILNLRETALSDRLDDFLIAAYGAIALAVLYGYRHELVRFRAIFPWLKAAFVLAFLQVVPDALANRPGVLSRLFADPQTVEDAVNWVDVVEGSLQLFAEALFLVSFFAG